MGKIFITALRTRIDYKNAKIAGFKSLEELDMNEKWYGGKLSRIALTENGLYLSLDSINNILDVFIDDEPNMDNIKAVLSVLGIPYKLGTANQKYIEFFKRPMTEASVKDALAGFKTKRD